MKTIEDIINDNEIVTEDLNAQYDDLITRLQEAKENQIPIDEGFFSALFGGIAGATAGPAVMKGICKVLGIDERGTLGNLLTSRMVLGSLGAFLGWKN